ncbi:hypothetical protein Pint_28060 [Pistacia integerrima]|uniref:Uncharacterized protein n=1 Tax=Pistacia integerrima TaxID=434235 RepID=A0ACC0YPW2_9ROSI|nr:hypothetical protein Pint_28060 [Pistacia integerrima]
MKCRVSGCSSDDFTFPFVIKACSSSRALGIGREIHCVVLRTGYDKNLVIQTALVDFYAKNGDMEAARVLIDRIPQPDLVSWNALIAGYSLNGLHQEAFETFRRALETGLEPNVSTLASVIPVCTRLGLFHIGKSLHGFIVKSGYMCDLFLAPTLISMYTGDFDLSTARKLFDSVVEKNVTVWNALISAYTQSKKFFEAFEMFRGMVRAQLKLDLVTFVSIIPSCEGYSCIDYGESLHACAVKHGLENQLSVSTAFLSMYAKFGNLDSAKFLFDQVPIRNLLSYNAMISGCVSNGLWDASLAVFREMKIEGFNPDAVSLISVISACSKLEVILLGKSVHAFSLRNGLHSNIDVSNALLMFYSDCDQLSYSFKLFHRMPLRNAVSWNTLISGCIHSGKTEEATILLEQMQKEGAELDMVTLISIIPCFSESENLKQGMAIHGYAVKTGYASDVSLANALITNNEVLVLFREMRREGQRPNHVSLLNLLPVCRTEKGFDKDVAVSNALIDLYYENEPRSMDIVEGAVKNAAGRETIDLPSGGGEGNQLS